MIACESFDHGQCSGWDGAWRVYKQCLIADGIIPPSNALFASLLRGPVYLLPPDHTVEIIEAAACTRDRPFPWCTCKIPSKQYRWILRAYVHIGAHAPELYRFLNVCRDSPKRCAGTYRRGGKCRAFRPQGYTRRKLRFARCPAYRWTLLYGYTDCVVFGPWGVSSVLGGACQ